MSKFTSCNDCITGHYMTCKHYLDGPDYFVPKPVIKKIDMSVLVGGDIDCEFGCELIDRFVRVGKLTAILDNTNGAKYKHDDKSYWFQCRVRQDHWHSWQGGDCPLPEGLIINVRTRGRSLENFNVSNYTGVVWGWEWSNQEADNSGDIIAFKVIGAAEGYSKWSRPTQGYDAGKVQWRECANCGKVQHRKMGYDNQINLDAMNKALNETVESEDD